MPRANSFADIWKSFRALPLWVVIWMMALLGPINMISLYVVTEPKGALVSALAWGGMLVSIPTLILHHGFTRLVPGGHVIFWLPLVLILIFVRPVANGAYVTYLSILLLANLASLLFDNNDLRLWFDGDRRAPSHKRSI